MSSSIREVDAKNIIRTCAGVDICNPCISITEETKLDEIPSLYPWILHESLVVKPDILLKRRGKQGLVKCNLNWEDVTHYLKTNLNTTICSNSLKGNATHFIVEPYINHDPKSEFYLAIRTLRAGDQILFSTQGGVDVGDVDRHAQQLTVPISEDGSIPVLNYQSLFKNVPNLNENIVGMLEAFVTRIYSIFCQQHFSFMEINPFCLDSKSGSLKILDLVAKLDRSADFLNDIEWTLCNFPAPFGRIETESEKIVKELDSKTGASFKFTILNPKGRIWTIVAGGGASVAFADTICDFGLFSELANYGEYSGAPSEMMTYEYSKTILSLVTAEGTYAEKGKILFIAGGIANFTSVTDTFRGIVRALREYQTPLKKFGVSIYVRRGGPGYQDGLKLMYSLGKELDIPIKVFGPEVYITDIIPYAINEIECDVTSTQGTSLYPSQKHLKSFHNTDLLQMPGQKISLTFNDPLSSKRHCGDIEESSDTSKDDKQTCSQFYDRSNKHKLSASKFSIFKGQLFSSETQCIVWGLQTRAVQEMLDFDHVCGRKIPSVASIVYEFSVSHVRPFYFGTEEIFIPVHQTLQEAIEQCPTADTLINFASFRSAAHVGFMALKFSQLRNMAVIAEGVPERSVRQLMSAAQKHNVTIIGPATVGGIRPGYLRIGSSGGSLENIMNCRLYRPGSVGLLTKSGGMLNEMNNILNSVTDGTCEGVAIGGDRFPGTSMLDHLKRFEIDPNIKLIVLLGEVGGDLEYEVADAIKDGTLTKPVVAWCLGTCASLFSTEICFGHAGAWAGSASESATSKNEALRNAGAHVPSSFHTFGKVIKSVFTDLVSKGIIKPIKEPDIPRVPMDYAWAKRLGLVRKPKGFVSSISDERGEELVYAGWPISKVLESKMGVGGVISLLWFKRPLPEYCYKYLEHVLMITADHGPAVCGAHNTIVTARAGKDLISSLISGLCTIGDRFGGACDQAAQQFLHAVQNKWTPEYFVKEMKAQNRLIMGIGHRIKSVHNPDMRVQILKSFCHTHFNKTSLIQFAEAVEKLTTKKRDTLILNVDGLIGVSMCDMLLGCGAFSESEAKDYIENGCINGLFVLGRSIGFIGHFLDQKRLKQGLYRHDIDDIAYVLPELDRP